MDLTPIVRCPQCKASLVARDGAFDCLSCRLSYPVRDDIPNFIPADAEPLPDARPDADTEPR